MASNRMTSRDLLLVGSVPLETVEEVFRAFGGPLGAHLACIPDGEVGDRQYWVDGVAYRVFNGHPELQTLSRPAPDDGVERWRPRSLNDEWEFRVRDGVKAVRFGDPGWRLGFAKDAINSHFIFRKLKEEGVIPGGVRFQVSIPLPNSVVFPYFHNQKDHARVIPGYEAALRAEVAKMVEKIPAGDLAIQWDAALEIGDLEGELPYLSRDGVLERNVASIPNVVAQIPSEVVVGYHLCFGTLGGWPCFIPKDLSREVEYTNAIVTAAGRRIDFVHIPTLYRADEAFYAPLKGLRIGDARLYLGMIHDMYDIDAFKSRLRTALKYFPDFGLAAPCGFGRLKASEVPQIVGDHLTALEIARQFAR